MEPTKNVGVLWRMWKWRIRERLWHSNVLDNLGEQFFPFCQYWVSILQCQRRNNHSLWLLHCPVEKISNILWLNGKVMNCLVKKKTKTNMSKKIKEWRWLVLVQRERERGWMWEGRWVRKPFVMYVVMRLCTEEFFAHYFEDELKERTNELTPLAAYLKLV